MPLVTPLMPSLTDQLERLLDTLEERPHLGYHHIALIIIVLGVLRLAIEQRLFPELEFAPIAQYHVVVFFYLAFVGGLFILYAMCRREVWRIANLIAKGFWIVLIPPLADYYVFGRRKGYFYLFNLDLEGFLHHFPTLFLSYTQRGGEHVYGLLIETYIISLGSAAYVYLRTRRPERAIATGALIYLYMILLAKGSSYIFNTHSNYLVSTHVFNTIFTISTLLFLSAILFLADRKTFLTIVGNIRPARTFTFIAMGLIGALLAVGPSGSGWELTSERMIVIPPGERALETRIEVPSEVGYMRAFALLSGLLAILFIQLTSVVANDLYDLEIDRESNPDRPLVTGALSPVQYRNLGVFFCVASFAFIISNALAVSPDGLIAIAGCLALLLAYSVPPLRLRRYVPNSIFIGLGAALCLLIGHTTQTSRAPSPLVWRAVSLTFLALSLGTNVKDLKDYESDRKHGVRTVFTLLGRRRGKRACQLLLAGAYLAPLFVIPEASTSDALVLILALVPTAWWFHERESLGPVFASFFLVLFYALGRTLGAF